MHIGAEIKRRRQALGWTLEDLADESGLSPRYLASLERDQRDPSLSTIEAVSRSLGAEPGDLLGPVKGLPPASVEAARLFSALPSDAQKAVVSLMRLLRRKK